MRKLCIKIAEIDIRIFQVSCLKCISTKYAMALSENQQKTDTAEFNKYITKRRMVSITVPYAFTLFI